MAQIFSKFYENCKSIDFRNSMNLKQNNIKKHTQRETHHNQIADNYKVIKRKFQKQPEVKSHINHKGSKIRMEVISGQKLSQQKTV